MVENKSVPRANMDVLSMTIAALVVLLNIILLSGR